MAEATDKATPAADASDEDINQWWTELRASGQTDKEIQRGMINIMVESYKEILLELDAVQLAGFEAESFPHWGGAYRPMFSETGHGSDGSGSMRLDSLRNDLEFAARKDVTDPSERLRALHRIYVRHATGVAERREMLALALLAEWMPVAGLRGPRTGPGTSQGRTPGPKGTEKTLPSAAKTGAKSVKSSAQKASKSKPKPVADATPAPKWHPKVQGHPEKGAGETREIVQARRFADRADVDEVYMGQAAKSNFKSPASEKFPDVVAKKTDGTFGLGEGKGTDMPKLVEQFRVAGTRIQSQRPGSRITEQEVVVEKLVSNAHVQNSPGPGGRVDAKGNLEVFNTVTEQWEPALPNGVPIKVIVRH